MKKIFLIFTLLANLAYLQAVTRYLDASSTDQTSLFQNLVNLCVAGDIIILRTGNHYLSGTVTVNKNSITIRGEANSIIRKSGSVSCIDVRCNNSIFDNLYIDGGNRPEPCMRVYGNYNQILNSTFRNSGNTGLLIESCHHNIVQGCKAYYNYMCGISQWAHSDGTIRDCQLYENGAEGLTIDGGSHNCMVYGNWIHMNNRSHRGVGGIGIDGSNGAWIHDNTIDYNGYDGIKFQNNLGIVSDGCRIYNNQNISYNEWCAVKFRFPNLVTNFGWWGNTCVGNPGGERCTTYNALDDKVKLSVQNPDIKLNNFNLSLIDSRLHIYSHVIITDCSIFNISGKVIYHEKLQNVNHYIDVSSFTEGCYIVCLHLANGTIANQKFIITKKY
ncbi:MAG: right-handed parallel beta-helix repeat-containing protein [Bacteroidales bacterium]|nr:right-handed parallel beta-helix repeat-containing protein [Bacteroidales bacterium]